MPDGHNITASFHKLTETFPTLEGADFAELCADIAANGPLSPIVVYQGKILDGRARYRACIAAGIEPETIELPAGTDPLGFLISANLHRRHLTGSQRAMIASRLINTKMGRPKKSPDSRDFTAEDAARTAGVSVATVSQAKVVRESGIKALVEKVEAGFLTVDTAAGIAAMPAAAQHRALSHPPERLPTIVKQFRRDQRQVDLAEKIEETARDLDAAPRSYGVILADPPWRFEPYSRDTGLDRAADNHYPTTTVEMLREMTVPAAPDAVLFLWATVPMLRDALDVMAAWGFAYKSHIAWVKNRTGLGYWTRNRHELLLIGTVGAVPAPGPGQQPSSVLEADVGRHSAKPQAVVGMIERLFPDVRKLEMFARTGGMNRDGWDYHGAES
jgi:N6-adenosine-specific RNA methylase IME4